MGLNSNGEYASIRRNAEATPDKFEYNKETGLFGNKGKHRDIREIVSDNPEKDARELFAYLIRGYDKIERDDEGFKTYHLADGTYVTMRVVTKSGSPAVEINIRNTIHGTKVQKQKIHFVKGEK